MLNLNPYKIQSNKRPDYTVIAERALQQSERLASTWLPHGRRRGHEWLALNPHRSDRRPGSFSINLLTGRWADFATGDRGGDLISLRAFLDGSTQRQAALSIFAELGGSAR
jgi:putative DNA primase/helicase